MAEQRSLMYLVKIDPTRKYNIDYEVIEARWPPGDKGDIPPNITEDAAATSQEEFRLCLMHNIWTLQEALSEEVHKNRQLLASITQATDLLKKMGQE